MGAAETDFPVLSEFLEHEPGLAGLGGDVASAGQMRPHGTLTETRPKRQKSVDNFCDPYPDQKSAETLDRKSLSSRNDPTRRPVSLADNFFRSKLTRADAAAQVAEDADEGGDEDDDKQGGQDEEDNGE